MKKIYRKGIFISSLAGIFYLFLDAILLEKYFFELKSFDIGNKGGGKKIKLLLLSDLHLKNRVWAYYAHLAKKVNQLNPHLLLIAGDILDRTGSTSTMDKFLSAIDPQLPKVAIAGNHDHKAAANLSAIQQVYSKYNCRLLLNETTAVKLQGHKIVITGLDDFIEGESLFQEAVKDVGAEEHHLLLLHSPLQQEKVKKEILWTNQQRKPEQKINIRYIFAGHNHGGQVKVPGFVPVLPAKSGNYVNGWYNSEAPFLYVSKGFGTTTIPFRFGARAEATVFHYHL